MSEVKTEPVEQDEPIKERVEQELKLEELNETQENINNLKKYPSFLFDNALSRYMNKLYDNKPSMDTSKISGKELREKELTPEDIQ